MRNDLTQNYFQVIWRNEIEQYFSFQGYNKSDSVKYALESIENFIYNNGQKRKRVFNLKILANGNTKTHSVHLSIVISSKTHYLPHKIRIQRSGGVSVP